MKKMLRNTVLGGALALSISAPLFVQDSALAAPTSSSTISKSSANSLTASGISSYSITHTKSGAKISGKLSGVTSPQKVTLRIADAPFKTQIGNFEWEYTDSKGNFTINIEDLNDSNPRYWQLERGGGWNSYFSYSPVIASGKIVSGQTVKYPTTTPAPAPSPTVPTPAPTVPGNYTNGKGGVYSNREFVKYSAAGKTGQYHIYADGIDPKKPVGVVFHFHGDGAYEFQNPSYKLTKIRTAAKSKNMIVVSMKAPNSSNSWWNGIEGNGDYTRALITNEIYSKYNVDKNRIWLLGYSGGSEFLSYEMMEEQNDLFTGGGALLFGGGGSPGSFARTPSASLKSNFIPIWYTGLDDNLNNSDPGWSAIADARKGYNFYKSSGFSKAQLITPAGIDHFEYDEGAVLKTTLDKYYK